MRTPLPSLDPNPMRMGAPERKVRIPLRSKPWRSMARSKSRFRRSRARSFISPRRVPNRLSFQRRFQPFRSTTMTSSTSGWCSMRSLMWDSAIQVSRASGYVRRKARTRGEENTMSPLALSRTSRTDRGGAERSPRLIRSFSSKKRLTLVSVPRAGRTFRPASQSSAFTTNREADRSAGNEATLRSSLRHRGFGVQPRFGVRSPPNREVAYGLEG